MNALNTEVEVNVRDRILKPVNEVFAAFIDPTKMSQYFISGASGPMKAGTTVEWEFADVGGKVAIDVLEVEENCRIAYEWAPGGAGSSRTTIQLMEDDPGTTVVTVNESKFPLDHEGVKRAMGQTAGWTYTLACLKAYLQFGINLRKGLNKRLTDVTLNESAKAMANERIEKRIELKAPISRVWRALTDYREFGEWFRVKLEGPFVAGQVSRGQMTYPGYDHVKWEAVVQKMEPERLFSFTWPHPKSLEKADHPKDYAKEPRTLVEFRLEKTANGTLLLVTESGFDKLPGDRRLEAFRRNEGGWTEQMKNIAGYVAKKP